MYFHVINASKSRHKFSPIEGKGRDQRQGAHVCLSADSKHEVLKHIFKPKVKENLQKL